MLRWVPIIPAELEDKFNHYRNLIGKAKLFYGIVFEIFLPSVVGAGLTCCSHFVPPKYEFFWRLYVVLYVLLAAGIISSLKWPCIFYLLSWLPGPPKAQQT